MSDLNKCHYEEALFSYKKAIQLDEKTPRNGKLWLYLMPFSKTFFERHNSEVLMLYDFFVETRPHLVSSYELRGKIKLAFGDRSGAAADQEKAEGLSAK